MTFKIFSTLMFLTILAGAIWFKKPITEIDAHTSQDVALKTPIHLSLPSHSVESKIHMLKYWMRIYLIMKRNTHAIFKVTLTTLAMTRKTTMLETQVLKMTSLKLVMPMTIMQPRDTLTTQKVILMIMTMTSKKTKKTVDG